MSRIRSLLLLAAALVTGAAGCNKKEEAKPAKDGSRLPTLEKDGGIRQPPTPAPPPGRGQ
jgi:hypothetical protein